MSLVPGAEAHGMKHSLCAVSQIFCIAVVLYCIKTFALMSSLCFSQILVNFEEGVGVSLVNKVPEELVFCTLSGIDVHYIRTAANEVLEINIQNIQVSSQQS